MEQSSQPGTLSDVPLFRPEWTALPGFTHEIQVEAPHYIHMFETLIATAAAAGAPILGTALVDGAASEQRRSGGRVEGAASDAGFSSPPYPDHALHLTPATSLTRGTAGLRSPPAAQRVALARPA